MKIEAIKALILRHIRSEGFQRRWRNVYWPFVKKWTKKTWAFYRDRAERRVFGEKYAAAHSAGQTFVHELEPNIPAGAAGAPLGDLPEYEDIADKLDKLTIESDEQGSTGQCVAFTFCNVYTHLTHLLYGVVQRFSEYDVYRYRTTKQSVGDDRGMFPDKVADRLVTSGIAVRGVLPDVRNNAQLIDADSKTYHDEVIDKYRIKGLIATGTKLFSWQYHGFDYIADIVRNLHPGQPFQISVALTRGYFGNDVPTVSGDVIGRHSIMGVGGFVFVDYGKRSIRIVDSAHRTGRATRFKHPSVRHFTEEFLTHPTTQATVRFFAMPSEISAKLEGDAPVIVNPSPTPVDPTDGPILHSAATGDRGEHVTKIQEALIARGYSIRAGATGYYGPQTASAVLAFQLNNIPAFARLYGQTNVWTETRLRALRGESFGPKTLNVFNSTS